MRKQKKVLLSKETLRRLDDLRLGQLCRGGNDTVVACPDLGQRSCGISNCASCTSP